MYWEKGAVFGSHSCLIWMGKLWNLCWHLPQGQEIVDQLIQWMQRIYLSLFFPFSGFTFVYCLVIYQYNTLALEHQCFPGKSWNPCLLHLITIKDALKFSDVQWLWFPLSRYFLFFLQTWNTFCTRAAKAVQLKIR